jgi:predicted DNA-binding transcriptional regulator YafY
VRRRTFKTSVGKTARQLAAKGVTEEQIERDIEALRKNRR